MAEISFDECACCGKRWDLNTYVSNLEKENEVLREALLSIATAHGPLGEPARQFVAIAKTVLEYTPKGR